MTSLKKNIAFNFIGQFYVGFIGIITLPLYLNLLGAEAYGLIGVFTLLQAWMQILDLGFSPTLSRQIAASKSTTSKNSTDIRTLLKSLEFIFSITAMAAALSIYLASDWVAQEWLSTQEIQNSIVSNCIMVMGLIIAIRWPVTLYRGGINGYEQQPWQNIANIIITTLRFPASLALIWAGIIDIYGYFIFQLVISLIEMTAFKIKINSLLPPKTKNCPFFSPSAIREVLPFAASSAYIGALWVLVTQLDKLILTSILPLNEYGYFSLAATISSAIIVLSGPLSTAILPRMTSQLSLGNTSDMLNIYRLSTRFLTCIIAPVVLVIAIYPYELIQLWANNTEASSWAKDVLPLFVIGNGLLAIGSFQSYLQYAYGNISLNVKYNTISSILAIPAIYYSATNYGAIGAGYTWIAFRLITLVIWTPFVHKKLAPGIHTKWITFDVFIPIASSAIFTSILSSIPHESLDESRALGCIYLATLTVSSIVFSLILNFPREAKKLFTQVILESRTRKAHPE